jgi:hypothetical protein
MWTPLWFMLAAVAIAMLLFRILTSDRCPAVPAFVDCSCVPATFSSREA